MTPRKRTIHGCLSFPLITRVVLVLPPQVAHTALALSGGGFDAALAFLVHQASREEVNQGLAERIEKSARGCWA